MAPWAKGLSCFGTLLLIVFGMVGVGWTLSLWQDGELPGMMALFLLLFDGFLLTIGAVSVRWIYVRNKQYVIFDREQYTLTQPRNALSVRHTTYSYKEIHLHRRARMAADHVHYIRGARIEPWYNFIGIQLKTTPCLPGWPGPK